MSGDQDDHKRQTEVNLENFIEHNKVQTDAHQSLLADAYDFVTEHKAAVTAVGVTAVALGVGYLTRGRWMPMLASLGAEGVEAGAIVAGGTKGLDAGAIIAGGKKGFDATKAGLIGFNEMVHPEMQGWRTALGGYADVGLDGTGSMIYRGAKAGTFTAENALLVNGDKEASTLFNALSRNGLLQRHVWAKGAAGSAAEFGEITLPGRTKFLLGEAGAVELPEGAKLIDLRNGQFHALTKENAEKLFAGLQKF